MNFRHSSSYRAVVMMICLLSVCYPVSAQQSQGILEQRVEKLEQYVTTIHPTMTELSNNLNQSIQEYTQGLETSLENYSQRLQLSLDERLNNLNRKVVVLDLFSTAYQSIEINTGTFLISVENFERLESGGRVHLNIGNPNFADYQNFKLKLLWGTRWAGERVMPYDQWRQSLTGGEYTFEGKIEKGKWNKIAIDLIPSDDIVINHFECEMHVSSVELGF